MHHFIKAIAGGKLSYSMKTNKKEIQKSSDIIMHGRMLLVTFFNAVDCLLHCGILAIYTLFNI